MENHFELLACIAQLDAMRYTPAGLPACDVLLEHTGSVQEAGQPRQVRLTAKAVALGTVAERLARQALGSQWQFSGFLTTPRNGRQLVLHIQDFCPI